MRTEEMIALVQCYIHHKKGVEVNIVPPRNGRQYLLLRGAYDIAVKFFRTVKLA